MPLDNRYSLKSILMAKGFKTSVAEWMITNLRPHQGGFVWRFNLPGIEEMIGDYYQRNMWPIVENAQSKTDMRLVRASESDRWSPSESRRFDLIQSKGKGHVLDKAGHWLHVDNMPGLQMMLMEHLIHL